MVCHVKGEFKMFIVGVLHLFASNTSFSSHVWLCLCLFLDEKSNVIGESDLKHNLKSLRG